jgi:hypothetical protein
MQRHARARALACKHSQHMHRLAVRQTGTQHYEIVGPGGVAQHIEGFVGRGGMFDGASAIALQHPGDELCHRWLVIDQQDVRGRQNLSQLFRACGLHFVR